MKRIKTTMLRLLHPGAACTILLIIVSAAALAYVFINGLEASPVGYAVYALSVYCLAIFIARLSGLVGRVKALLYGNKYSSRFMTDILFRTQITMYTSLFINIIYAVFQLVVGIIYASFWYGAVAVYYIVICGVRFLLLRYFRKEDQNSIRELKAYRFCGLLLFALNIAVVGMVIQMVRDGQGARYPGLMIYAMATYAFYRITISIINVVKYRKLNSPVLSAAKALNLATALMAIFSLEAAMIAEFGDAGDFEHMITSATGGGVCFIIFCMAIYMVVHANRVLKELSSNHNKNSSHYTA